MNNLETFKSEIEKSLAAQRQELNKKRKAMLAVLQKAGITKVSAEYEGYGDEGNIEKVTIEPENSGFKDTDETLKNLLWSIAYNTNLGFENNDGGQGDLAWDIASDKINITHHQFYTESTTTTHEDV